jgi:hypothetical protein
MEDFIRQRDSLFQESPSLNYYGGYCCAHPSDEISDGGDTAVDGAEELRERKELVKEIEDVVTKDNDDDFCL